MQITERFAIIHLFPVKEKYSREVTANILGKNPLKGGNLFVFMKKGDRMKAGNAHKILYDIHVHGKK